MPDKRDPLHKALGGRVRILRDQRGWTQEILAQAVDIETATLSRYETGRLPVPVAVLARIAQALDVPITRMVSAVPAPKRAPADQGTRKLLGLWSRMGKAQRELALRLLREVARRR